MRTIKFRAWDTSERLTKEYMSWAKDKGLFLGGDSKVIEEQEKRFEKETGLKYSTKEGRMLFDVHISNKGKVMELEGGWDYQSDNENAVVMQFTGLLDKNGKEIYEGDIVKWDGWSGATEVRFEDAHFVLYPNRTLSQQYSEDYEVIGNIYENKELLKGR